MLLQNVQFHQTVRHYIPLKQFYTLLVQSRTVTVDTWGQRMAEKWETD